jgi:hypothetical protein
MEKLPANKWKWAFGALLTVTLGLGLWLTYRLLDQGVTITYMSEGYTQTEKSLDLLLDILPKLSVGLQKKDLIFLIRQQDPKSFVVDKAAEVSVDQLIFRFDERGRLVGASRQQ